MDCRNGNIYTAEEVLKMLEDDRKYMVPMGHHPTPEQRTSRKVGRNDPCPCGSRNKFKKCCLWNGDPAKNPKAWRPEQ